MKLTRIRASAVTALTAIVFVGISATGASAAEPVSHDVGSASVGHVSGTNIASAMIHETTACGGVLAAIELAH